MSITVNNIDYDKVYHTNNYGDFIFLEEVEPHRYVTSYGRSQTERMAKIRFLLTNTEITVRVRDAIRGMVKDPYYPKIYGVACVGNTYTNEDHRFFYKKWKSMISRCYNEKDVKYKFYKNCSVIKEWLCFENFLKDVAYLPGYEEMMINKEKIIYTLDKDKLQQGKDNKIYSKETCMWIPLSENLKQEAIDYRANNVTTSNYFGIVLDQGKYKVQSSVRTQYGNPVGVFTDEIAAVNMREYFRNLN